MENDKKLPYFSFPSHPSYHVHPVPFLEVHGRTEFAAVVEGGCCGR